MIKHGEKKRHSKSQNADHAKSILFFKSCVYKAQSVEGHHIHKVSNVLKSFQSSRKFDREWRGKARIFNFPLTALKNKNVRRAYNVFSSRFNKAR